MSDVDLMTTREAAAFLRVTPWLMNDWRRRGIGPAHYRVGAKLIRYRRADLVEWLGLSRVGEEGSAGGADTHDQA